MISLFIHQCTDTATKRTFHQEAPSFDAGKHDAIILLYRINEIEREYAILVTSCPFGYKTFLFWLLAQPLASVQTSKSKLLQVVSVHWWKWVLLKWKPRWSSGTIQTRQREKQYIIITTNETLTRRNNIVIITTQDMTAQCHNIQHNKHELHGRPAALTLFLAWPHIGMNGCIE